MQQLRARVDLGAMAIKEHRNKNKDQQKNHELLNQENKKGKKSNMAQSVGAVEYTDCISAEA